MQTFQELMTSALAEAGYSDEQVSAALGKIYSHEKLGPKLNSLVKTATEDYAAQVGRVRQYQDWYSKAQPEYDRMAAEYTKAVAELEAHRANPNAAPPAIDTSQFITRADFQADKLDSARRYAAVLKDSNRLTARHAIRFQEEPDFEAIDKIAMEQNLPIPAAYEKWVEPRVKEQEKAANEKWKKEQREEIERDLRSRYKLPAEAVPTETAPMYRKQTEAPKDIEADLIEAWNSVPAKS